MLYVIKLLITSTLIVVITEVSKRNTTIGAILLSLPIVSIISFIWIWNETKDSERISQLSTETLMYVIPTLPMFYLLSVLLKNNVNFYLSLVICSVLTFLLFYLTQYIFNR